MAAANSSDDDSPGSPTLTLAQLDTIIVLAKLKVLSRRPGVDGQLDYCEHGRPRGDQCWKCDAQRRSSDANVRANIPPGAAKRILACCELLACVVTEISVSSAGAQLQRALVDLSTVRDELAHVAGSGHGVAD